MMKSDPVYKEAAKVSIVLFVLGAAEFLIFTAFMSFRIDILVGTLYGCAFSSLNFLYLAYCVKKSVEKEPDAAKAYMGATYTSRVFLTAAMLIIAFRLDIIYIWAAVIPLFLQRIAIFAVNFFNNRSGKS